MAFLGTTATLLALSTVARGQVSTSFYVCQNGVELGNNAHFDTNFYIRGDLDYGQDGEVVGELAVTGSAVIANRFQGTGGEDLDIEGDATLGQDIDLDEGCDLRVGGNLVVGNRFDLYDDVDVGGSCTFGFHTMVNGDLDCLGDMTARNQLYIGGTLEAASVSLRWDNTIGGDIEALGPVEARGRTTVAGDVTSTDSIDLGSMSTVSGDSTQNAKPGQVSVDITYPDTRRINRCNRDPTFRPGNDITVTRNDGAVELSGVYGRVTLEQRSTIVVGYGVTSIRRLNVMGTHVTIYIPNGSSLFVQRVQNNIPDNFNVYVN